MDLLFKRYASPFLLLDGYVQTSRFCEFVNTMCRIKAEDDMWDYFLHKVWDKGYPDFKKEIENAQAHNNMSDKDVEKTIQKSMNILQNFNPQGEEGEI